MMTTCTKHPRSRSWRTTSRDRTEIRRRRSRGFKARGGPAESVFLFRGCIQDVAFYMCIYDSSTSASASTSSNSSRSSSSSSSSCYCNICMLLYRYQ